MSKIEGLDKIIIYGNATINVGETVQSEDIEKSVHQIRSSNAVTSAKKKVKSRDGCCQCCGEIPANNHLEIHHILPVAKYKNLASDEGNMIALCQKCHRKYHDQHDDENINAVTFAKYLKDYGNRRY